MRIVPTHSEKNDLLLMEFMRKLINRKVLFKDI